MALSSSSSILAQLRQTSQAAETANGAVIAYVPSPPAEETVLPPTGCPTTDGPVDVTAIPELSLLPETVRQLASIDRSFREKLLKQTPLFMCPAWSGVPIFGQAHLEVHREGAILQNLWVCRFPFYLVGRDPRCDFVLDHPSVSATHCAILYHRERHCFVVMDLGSTNGVYLNGTRVEARKPQAVDFETVIRFGYSSRSYILKKTKPRKALGEPVEKTPAGTALGVAGTAEKKELGVSASSVQPAPALDPRQQPTVAKAEAPEAVPTVSRHLRHLLLKHKDVGKPVSAAPRNKGEPITRSKEDALALANSIRMLHAVWSDELFQQACREHSEDNRSGSGGDLGMVSRGDFAGPFDTAAFAIGIEQVSLPVQTQLGVHLIFRCKE